MVNPAPSRVTTELSAAGEEIQVSVSPSDSATLHGVTATASVTTQYRYYGTLAACDSDVAAFPRTSSSRHVTCTALNRRTLAIPVGPAQTGAASPPRPVAPGAGHRLALMRQRATRLGSLRLRPNPVGTESVTR